MSSGTGVFVTIMLIVVAGVTAGLWLNLIMWLPMLALGAMHDEEAAFVIVSLLSMVVAGAVVFAFGLFVLGLPWYAAAIAGLLVGLTSYARPNAAAEPLY
jgi:hypothetical protein